MKTERDKRMITELESQILHKVARIEFPYDYGADVKDILLILRMSVMLACLE